jgi:serine/threonine-protein kinase RsbW
MRRRCGLPYFGVIEKYTMKLPVEVLSLEVPCDRDAPGAVREALNAIDSLGWVLGDVMLVASELVTNAILHSGCVDEHVLKVKAALSPDRMVISVIDPGLSGKTAHPRPADREEAVSGWGLRIVDQLAARWGSERAEGYRVWAEVALA